MTVTCKQGEPQAVCPVPDQHVLDPTISGVDLNDDEKLMACPLSCSTLSVARNKLSPSGTASPYRAHASHTH